MKTVLMVSYYFPPSGGVGVQRTLKFVKYLPEQGWRPIVLTIGAGNARLKDTALETEIPPGVEIHRTKIRQLPQALPWRVKKALTAWLLVVDEQLGWLPYAVAAGKDIIEQGQVHAIYSTSTPYTAHLVARNLHQKTNLPWIADFRDPWVDRFAAYFPTGFHRGLARRLEGQVCETASRVTITSERMRQDLLAAHPGLPPEKVITLTNGYDPADFANITTRPLDPNKFNLVYTGSFYTQQRTPEAFLTALRTLVEGAHIPLESLAVHLVGNLGAPARRMVASLAPPGIVTLPGFLPHAEALGYLRSADLLLLFVGSGPGSHEWYPAKIFEYLAARRPVIALAPPGAASDLIEEAGAGVIVDPDDPVKIAAAILDLFHRWQEGSLQACSRPEVIERYDRRRLTSQLAGLLDQITAQRGPA